jgi:glycosyltransferase involved in cell wall biosynthesis
VTAEAGGAPDRIVVVVPAHDEATRIASTVASLRTIPGVTEVVVVDDGSHDETAAEAGNAGARVVRLGRKHGKGPAMMRGVAASDAPVLLFADADLGASAANLGVLLAPVLDGSADVAIAAPPRGDGPSGFGLVEAFSRWGIVRLTGQSFDRPLSGQRALRRSLLDTVGPFAAGFGVETGFTVDAVRAGYRVVEVPCEIRHARTGRDPAGFAHRARQAADVLRALTARWRRR